MKTIKLNPGKLLGFKILQQTQKSDGQREENSSATTISGKIGAKPSIKPATLLAEKPGIKPGN